MLRLSPEERQTVERLAERLGLTLTDAVRVAIRQAAEQHGVMPKARRRRAR
jgi:hypothetical protein